LLQYEQYLAEVHAQKEYEAAQEQLGTVLLVSFSKWMFGVNVDVYATDKVDRGH
jgi:hypothetical protein